MGRPIPLTVGDVYGNLTVTSTGGTERYYGRMYTVSVFLCVCGVECIWPNTWVRRVQKPVKSCGCLNTQRRKERLVVLGGSGGKFGGPATKARVVAGTLPADFYSQIAKGTYKTK